MSFPTGAASDAVQTLLHGTITVVAFLLILGILVLVHELGHFLTARLFKVRVEEFGLGFPPRLYPRPERVKRLREEGKIIYSLNALPLGGFVRLAGENGTPSAEGGRASARPGAALALDGTPTMPDDPGAFGNKPPWQRGVILAAGAFNNMVLAIGLAFLLLFVVGTPQASVEITKVALRSPAYAAGLLPGDVIGRVDGRTPRAAVDVRNWIAARAGHTVSLTVSRHARDVAVQVMPRTAVQTPCDQGLMGVVTAPVDVHNVRTDFGPAAGSALSIPGAVLGAVAALPASVFGHPATVARSSPSTGRGREPVCTLTSDYLTFNAQHTDEASDVILKNALTADPCLASTSGGGVTGPIGIARQVGCEANNVGSQGLIPLLSLMIDLSATLAVVNLLPIPALDGGRILFVLITIVSRRRVRPETEALVHAMGMVALLSLMAAISVNDLSHILTNRPTF